MKIDLYTNQVLTPGIGHFLIHGFAEKTVGNRGRIFTTFSQTVALLFFSLPPFFISISLFFKKKEEKKRGRAKVGHHRKYYKPWDFGSKPWDFEGVPAAGSSQTSKAYEKRGRVTTGKFHCMPPQRAIFALRPANLRLTCRRRGDLGAGPPWGMLIS